MCKGTRSVRLKQAYAKGWKKADLQEEGCGTWCYCPECYDDAAPCIFCFGDGFTNEFIESQQRARILLMAKYNDRMPVTFKRDNIGRLTVDTNIDLLSMFHANALRDEGLIEYYGSFFGHGIMLHDAGKLAAMKAEYEYRALCRQHMEDRRKMPIERELYQELLGYPKYVECEF
jgi:hypothetical protein